MVEWRLARRIAEAVAGDPGLPRLAGDLEAYCADGAARVAAYTLLEPAAPLPAPELVGRPGWLDANLALMRDAIDPVVERWLARRDRGSSTLSNVTATAGGLVLAAEVGGLSGLMAQRVLGQYEVSPVDPDGPARLLFVAPNLRDAVGKLGVDEASMVHWVALHEVTHAVQFASVPWLRAHVAALARELLDAADVSVRVDLRAVRTAIRRGELRERLERVRDDGLLTTALGPERRDLLDRMQATMALIEGHAEHVMDAVGRDVLDDLDELRAGMTRRRRERSASWRLVERLLGLDLKMRQYDVGKRFCDAVVAEAGVAGLNCAWAAPELLPTLDELDDPVAWMARAEAGSASDAA